MWNKKTISALINIIIPILLTLSFFLISSLSIREKTATTDEARHLVRGIMLLKTGDYRLNQHHPILANTIDAIPLLFNDKLVLEDTNTSEAWRYADKDLMADNIIELNGGLIPFSQNILYPARIISIIFSSLFVLFFYYILRYLFKNPLISIIATSLLSFSPIFIAHSSLVTTDSFSLITIFLATVSASLFITRYREKKWLFLLAFILTSILALLTKYTSVIPIFFLIILISAFVFKKEKRVLLKVFIPAIIIIGMIFLLSASYSFHFATLKDMAYQAPFRLEDDLKDISRLPVGIQEISTSVYENFKFPFPQYIRGFYENVLKHSAYGHKSYLLQEYSTNGWLLYFPIAYVTKELLGTVILSISALMFGIKKRVITWNNIALFITPLVLIIFSLTSSLNLGVRHILPLFPFFFLGIGIVWSEIINKFKSMKYVLSGLLLFNLLSVLTAFPHYLEYFNPIIGNKQNAYKVVRDSNLDWGQNELYVAKYLKENPNDIVVSVETLFKNPKERDKNLERQFETGLLRRKGYISNTHWVLEKGY